MGRNKAAGFKDTFLSRSLIIQDSRAAEGEFKAGRLFFSFGRLRAVRTLL